MVLVLASHTAQKMKFFIEDFFSKCDQICWKLRIWSHLLKKSLMENFIFCAVSSFKRVAKQELCLYHYHIKVRHQLQENDFRRRLTFCQWFQNRCHILYHNFIPHLVSETRQLLWRMVMLIPETLSNMHPRDSIQPFTTIEVLHERN